MNLKGQVALVTGSSRGIGRRIAVSLAGQGADAAARLLKLDAEARGRIDAAVTFAVGSPLPAAETAFDHVFA